MSDNPRFDEVAVDRREETVATAQPGYTTTEQTVRDIAAAKVSAAAIYPTLKSISIDHAVMEHATGMEALAAVLVFVIVPLPLGAANDANARLASAARAMRFTADPFRK